MGGNALKETRVGRLTRSNYNRVSKRVVAELLAAIPGIRVAAIPAYKHKADFGDLDVLMAKEALMAAGGPHLLRKIATDCFYAQQIVRNGPVYSFDYRESADQTTPGFQVDVILQEDSAFDYGLNYFSFNDLGNLIGRIAYKIGVAHRHDGLYWYFRDGTYLFKEICLTLDPAKALSFLGFSPERYVEGFEGLQDIYEYVGGSAFFNPELYLLANRNHTARTRDRKRKTYMGFLDWCAKHPELPAYEFPEDKAAWRPRLKEHFPHFVTEEARVLQEFADARLMRERFNGTRVRDLTGYTGRELGAFMVKVRSRFESEAALREFLLGQTSASIDAFVLGLKSQFELIVETPSPL